MHAEHGGSQSAERLGHVDAVAFGEGFVESEECVEVTELIVLGLSHFAPFDHFKNHATEVVGGLQAPVTEDDGSHRTVLPQPEDSYAFQQLLAGDVMSLIKAFAGVLTARDLLSGLQCF